MRLEEFWRRLNFSLASLLPSQSFDREGMRPVIQSGNIQMNALEIAKPPGSSQTSDILPEGRTPSLLEEHADSLNEAGVL